MLRLAGAIFGHFLASIRDFSENVNKAQIIKEYHSLLASKGGRTRALNLSPERRKEIAVKAAAARWRGPILRAIDPSTLGRIPDVRK